MLVQRLISEREHFVKGHDDRLVIKAFVDAVVALHRNVVLDYGHFGGALGEYAVELLGKDYRRAFGVVYELDKLVVTYIGVERNYYAAGVDRSKVSYSEAGRGVRDDRDVTVVDPEHIQRGAELFGFVT